MIKEELADRLVALFTGNQRSSGRWDPKTDKMHVEYVPVDAETMDAHLEGITGCGVVPITDDGNCLWAAIDIDNHGSDHDLPINEVDARIHELQLPVIPCRSKSGGIHVYLFLRDPQPAGKIRGIMAEWATKLGYGGSEIFPKQSKLTLREGKMSYGNWINLPYFGGDATVRYAVVDGKRLTTAEFIEHAEQLRLGAPRLRSLMIAEHPEAPPCIQTMLARGVAQGQRNEAMYNIAVYLRKFNPETATTRAEELNQLVFDTPLPRAELKRTINSAMKPEYGYRCGEEVIKQHCDRSTCLTRGCGITNDEAEKYEERQSLPTFSDLAKYLTEPVRWEITIDNVRVFNIGTEDLLDWRVIRKIIADRLTRVVPLIKNNEWERMLAPLMQTARIIETPDDASVNGIIRDRLREFCAKSDLFNRGEDPEDRKVLLRGMPVVQTMDGERCVCFRAQDFVGYLKRTKSEELKGVHLFFAVQGMGVLHKKLRVTKEESCNVWYLPVRTVVQDLGAEPVEFKSDL